MRDLGNSEDRMDRNVNRNLATAHFGVQRTPAEELMAKEAGEDEGDPITARVEAFRGMLDYFFSHGAEPAWVLRMVDRLAKVLHHPLGAGGLDGVTVISGTPGTVSNVRIRQQPAQAFRTAPAAALPTLNELIERGAEEPAGEHDRTWIAVLDYFMRHGREPLQVLRTVFAIAKAIRPELIGDMSMDDIAIACGDGGKATVSARIQRVYNVPVAGAGRAEARASCQKAGNYSAPQKGNRNRKGSGAGQVAAHQDLTWLN